MPVKVHVEYISIFYDAMGKKREDIEVEKKSVLKNLLTQLVDKDGEKIIDSVLDSNRNIKSHILVLLNGRSLVTTNDLENKLRNGDRVTLGTVLSGG